MGILKDNPPISTRVKATCIIGNLMIALHLWIQKFIAWSMVPHLTDPNLYPQILSCQLLLVFFFPKMVTDFWTENRRSKDGSISSSRCRTSRWQSANGLCIHCVWKPEMFHDWSCFMCFRNPSLLWNKMYMYIYVDTTPKDFKHFYDWDLSNLATRPIVTFHKAFGADAVWAQCQTYESVGLLSVSPFNQRFIRWISTFPPPNPFGAHRKCRDVCN